MIKQKAHAKINLCLDVVGKRANGYHDLDMIMLPLELHDELWMEKSDQDYFESNDNSIPIDEHNTIIKAYRLMKEKYQLDSCIHVRLVKNIPAQAGLAGGSSDGAAMLRGLNELFDLKLSLEKLAEIGLKIGADVAFCIYQTSAQVQGIGDIVKPFKMDWNPYILLVKPSYGISTKDAYELLDHTTYPHCNSDEILELLHQQNYQQLAQAINNSLETSAFELQPSLKQLKQAIKAQGFNCCLMSGSGSTIFAISENYELVNQAYDAFLKQGYECFITRFI